MEKCEKCRKPQEIEQVPCPKKETLELSGQFIVIDSLCNHEGWEKRATRLGLFAIGFPRIPLAINGFPGAHVFCLMVNPCKSHFWAQIKDATYFF